MTVSRSSKDSLSEGIEESEMLAMDECPMGTKRGMEKTLAKDSSVVDVSAKDDGVADVSVMSTSMSELSFLMLYSISSPKG